MINEFAENGKNEILDIIDYLVNISDRIKNARVNLANNIKSKNLVKASLYRLIIEISEVIEELNCISG